MSLEQETKITRSHEDIISGRDEKLNELKTSIETDPKAEWVNYEVAEGLEVKLPAQAVIEAEALVEDASTNLELFQNRPQALLEHGEVVRNPRSFGFVMSGIFEKNEDWDGIKVRVALQRGMTIYEDQMEQMDYDFDNPVYKDVSSSFKNADKALKALDHLRPMNY